MRIFVFWFEFYWNQSTQCHHWFSAKQYLKNDGKFSDAYALLRRPNDLFIAGLYHVYQPDTFLIHTNIIVALNQTTY